MVAEGHHSRLPGGVQYPGSQLGSMVCSNIDRSCRERRVTRPQPQQHEKVVGCQPQQHGVEQCVQSTQVKQGEAMSTSVTESVLTTDQRSGLGHHIADHTWLSRTRTECRHGMEKG